MGRNYADRARALVGTRFRPQGRSPEQGLDCVGLVLETYKIGQDAVRRNYRLRGDYQAEIERELVAYFRRAKAAKPRSGDLILLAVAADQLHFAVCTRAGFVHADAHGGYVVETPGQPQWPIVGIFRRRATARRDR